MNSYKTLGIVIKGMNFGEADKILTIFTERLGKIKVMTKGVRKIKSHLAGALEPFMLVNLQISEGKTFYMATGATVCESFPSIHQELSKMGRAFFLGELIDNFAGENEKMAATFELFADILRALENGARPVLYRAFELKLIESAGFKPELFECLHCRKNITPGLNFWDEVEGGVICEDCQKVHHHGREISDNLIKLFRFIEKSDFVSIERLKLDQDTEAQAEEILASYARNILEKELKSEKFLKMIE